MLTPNQHLLIFTDLDGSLLDHDSYSWRAAQPWLDRLAAAQTPLIIATSKTAAEVAPLRQRLGLQQQPFIAENGAQTVFPAGWREAPLHAGATYPEICAILAALRERTGFAFQGFADADDARVAEWTGLSPAEAHLARRRAGSEPLRWSGTDEQLAAFRTLLALHDLRLTQGGRFHHVMSRQVSKGEAARRLVKRLQHRRRRPLTTLALGDGPNDISLLQACDLAVLIRGRQAKPLALPSEFPGRLYRTRRQGPQGWSEGLDHFLSNGGSDHE
ncbi:mannosyl-3-phosphoglycerate phosphatase-related protein [Serratia ficaria]|uniref:mannosyl-3-phosphoglycerate phosphatase-related protein n=1 Tax=Serratia ficaria TaxID=61651 RepID=UPI002ED37BC8|nr:mannosyl-3-phosphoglycerate phosphatase-related protein [Serratia ficaria]